MIAFDGFPDGIETLAFLKERASALQALMPNLYDAVGLVGVALYVIAYMGVQIGQIDGNRMLYCCLNGVAAGCILFSMMGAFNLAGALVNGLFMLFSVIGAIRLTMRVHYTPTPSDADSFAPQKHPSDEAPRQGYMSRVI